MGSTQHSNALRRGKHEYVDEINFRHCGGLTVMQEILWNVFPDIGINLLVWQTSKIRMRNKVWFSWIKLLTLIFTTNMLEKISSKLMIWWRRINPRLKVFTTLILLHLFKEFLLWTNIKRISNERDFLPSNDITQCRFFVSGCFV